MHKENLSASNKNVKKLYHLCIFSSIQYVLVLIFKTESGLTQTS